MYIHQETYSAASYFACHTPLMHRLHTHYTQSPTGGLSLLLLLVQVPIIYIYVCVYIYVYIYIYICMYVYMQL